uniref:Transposase Tc1-like domain-containing protein n=1 Tax=Oncorhynchus tshawytscha TaxID=74940 RepID=A0AAZ3RR12_ONCTS
MGPCIRHTAQEGDSFCLLQMNVLNANQSQNKVQINPRTIAKDLVKMLEETGTKVSIFTVKRVIYQHNLKGHSARTKPLFPNRHKKSQSTDFNCILGQRSYFFWRNDFWSD